MCDPNNLELLLDDDAAVLVALNSQLQNDCYNEESDDDEERRDNRRVFVDVECWRNLSGTTFTENFRMKRSTFEKLHILVGNHLAANNRMVRLRTPLDLCLLMAVWILANGDTFRSTAAHFRVSKGVVFYHYLYIIEALRELVPRFVKWPNAIERDSIKFSFEEKYGYPGVVGCVDGTNIDVTAPLEQPQRYVNRHHGYAVIAQAVCDHNLLYRDIFVGQPGSVGDGRTFSRSPLSSNLRRPDIMREDEHLLGDKACPLSGHVLIPYIDDNQLTPQQKHHNKVLSSCRASVERSFALLFGKFRRMKLLHSYSIEYCIDHIIASLVLHNFIILGGEECPGVTVNFDPLAEPAPDQAQLAREVGAQKREIISRLLRPVG